MQRIALFILLVGLLVSCTAHTSSNQTPADQISPLQPAQRATSTPDYRGIPITPISVSKIPNFDHIIVILFENSDYAAVIGNKRMPTFNQLARQNILLTQYHALTHPSLPNYIALIGGSTYGIDSDCTDCFINQPSLPDLIEASGRTWKTYQEDLPAPCFVGDAGEYAQRHNPFIYFDRIRKDTQRCQESVVPLTQLDQDLKDAHLPNFSFIMPNLCHSGHDCSAPEVDKWMSGMVSKLLDSPALGHNYLLVIGFDESEEDTSSCCGLPKQAGGRIPFVLISPQAKKSYQDDTPMTHYNLLKTILAAWSLPALGYTALPITQVISSVWLDEK